MIYQTYQEHLQQTQAAIKKIELQINRNSLGRLALILMGGAALFYAGQEDSVVLVAVLAVLIIALFTLLIKRQSKLDADLSAYKDFLKVNENEILLQQQRQTIYDQGADFEDFKHPYTADLDIFGSYSLFTLLNRCATQLGVHTLATWLSRAAPKEEILQRQATAAEIAADLSWSQQFQAKLLFNIGQKVDVKQFLKRYFEDSSFSFGHAFMRFYVPIAPFVLLASVLLSIFVVDIWRYIGILALIHFFWTFKMGGQVGLFSSRVDKVGKLLDSYASAIALIENKEFHSSTAVALQQQLHHENIPTSKAFSDLASLINKLDARNNMFVGAILNILFLWDFKQVLSIIQWKEMNQQTILKAFDVVASFEALNSLAVLQRNHPQWVVPEILDQPATATLDAQQLRHPLISDDKSVANSYSSAQHRIALITGSNMAGKSTFLRTIGINAVLAYSGAVVHAQHLALPIYHFVSYMRSRDSLMENTSTFKAELDRMKFILDTVDADRASYFLIDEMLRGTNSVDKYLGSRAIIKKLILQSGNGMVATHDLQLSSLADEYPGLVQNYHFDVQVIDGEMLFDYKIKDGQCTIFNASLLLKGIGVDVETA